jgi:zinc protease
MQNSRRGPVFVSATQRNRWLLLAGWLLAAISAFATPWPHEVSDLEPDPALHFGRLENGVRYVIRPNAEPRGRVALVMQVAVGSIHERDDQLGYAHFLEHMMFRGTRRFPANTLIGKLQHEGLAMGADTSAFTSHLSTFYNLDLPQNTAEKISLGLSILRDFADGATLARKDIQLEAKVIESEYRTRDSSGAQIGESLAQFLQPDSRYTLRPPIGTLASIRAATAEKLREFHQQWYRPSRLTLIAVGDADPALMESLIRQHFGTLTPSALPEPPEPTLITPAPPQDVQTKFFSSPTDSGTTTLLYSVKGPMDRDDSRAAREQMLIRNAAFWMLDARLDAIIQKSLNEYGASEASWSNQDHTGQLALIRIDSRRDLWRGALRLADQELRRALQHGFTTDEFVVQKEAFKSWFAESIRIAPNRQSPSLAEQIREALETNLVITSPESDWTLAEPVLNSLSLEQCLHALRESWSSENRRVAVVGKYPDGLPSEELLAAYEESRAVTAFAAHDERTLASFAYTDFGPPGEIIARHHIESAHIESVQFANGVRANLKRTDYEHNRVHVRVRLSGGLSREPADKIGLGLVTNTAFLAGGLQRHDMTELGRILAGDSLGLSFSVEEEACYFTGVVAPEKLERLMQLIAAYLTDAAYRPESFTSAFSQLQSYYAQLIREPSQFLSGVSPQIMANGDSRYGLPRFDHIAMRTPQEAKEWLDPMLTSAPIEIGIAGTFDLEPTLTMLSATFGALPARTALPPADLTRRPSVPTKSIDQKWPLETTEAKGAVRVYWPAVDSQDFRTSRKLQILSNVLNDRLRKKIREDLGATYGPEVDAWGSEIWSDYGYLFVAIETSPKQAARVAKLTRKIAEDIARKGITDEEFNRALGPQIATLDQQLRDNQYWTYHILAKLQEDPARLQWPLTREHDYRTMTRQSVEAVARTYLRSERAHTFIAVPR